MSKLAELLIVAIVPLLVSLYPAAVDVEPDDDYAMTELDGIDIDLHAGQSETEENSEAS